MDTEIEFLIKLSDEEDKKFTKFIREKRAECISSPKNTTKKATESNLELITGLLDAGEISEAIFQLRELSYNEFLKEESIFNGVVLEGISKQFDTPKEIINDLSSKLYQNNYGSAEEFTQGAVDMFGTYSGAISPYIYQLCLSNTQSRRSRAGQVFEGIIYYLYEYFGYPYGSQAQVGRQQFTQLGLGKLVDSVLPGLEEFDKRRNKTIVGSMKTTLRERWQEVVEEVARANIPSIHLLTVDDDISEAKALQMGQHNIVLVVLNSVKAQPHLASLHSVVDFETYFLQEIPDILRYWKANS